LVGMDVSCTGKNRDLIGLAYETGNRDTQTNCPTIAMNAGEFGRTNQSDHHVL
jgi:hypothetical protein